MYKIQLFQLQQQCRVQRQQSTQDEISIGKIRQPSRSLAYVKNVKTQSIQNASIVTVEYENNTDMDKAEEQLKKEIDKIKFKDEVGQPK